MDYRERYMETGNLLAECQAQLGTCIGMMRHAATLMETDFPATANMMREQAEQAEKIRWAKGIDGPLRCIGGKE